MTAALTPFRLRHLLETRLAELLSRFRVLRPWLVRRFVADLQLLNDALRDTELNGHYWVWSGLLLGWAREGAVLQHDCLDADFGVDDADFGLLVDAIPALLRAGFRCDRRFVNDAGQTTELTLLRHGARFEFFRMFPADGQLRYYMYNITLKEITQVEATLPGQEPVPFSFLDRTWSKHRDHELELRAIYGSWQVPDPSWSYLDTLDIGSRRVSPHANFDWRDGAAALAEDSYPRSSATQG
jgi:hypothetical protein